MTVLVYGGTFDCPRCGRRWNVEYRRHPHQPHITFRCPCKGA